MATELSYPSISGVTGAPYISALSDTANIQDTINYLYYGSTKSATTTNGLYGMLTQLQSQINAVSSGINVHENVKWATTTTLAATYAAGSSDGSGGTGINATITFSATGVQKIDSTTTNLSLNDRVLVKDGVTADSGTSSKANGIYYVSTVPAVGVAGILKRALDSDNSIAGEMAEGDFLYITDGDTNANKAYILTTSSATGTGPSGTIKIGIDNITYTQFIGVGSYYVGTSAVQISPAAQTLNDITLSTPVIDVINSSSATSTSPSLYSNITSGTIAIGDAVTTGTIKIGATAAGAKNINIGTSTGTTTINGTLVAAAPAGSLTGSSLPSGITSASGLQIVGTIGTGTWQGTKIAIGYGGTNLTSYAKGDILYASATNTLASLPITGASDGWVLTYNSTSGIPEWRVVSSGSGFTGAGTSITNITGAASNNMTITSATSGNGNLSLLSAGSGTFSIATAASTTATTGTVTIKSGDVTVATNTGAGTVTVDTGARTGTGTNTLNLGNTNATTINIGTAASSSGTKAINIGTNGTTGSTTTITLGTTGGTTPTITLNGAVTLGTTGLVGPVSMDAFNTVSTTLNIGGAATTLTLGNTATAAQAVNMFTAATGGGTYNFVTAAASSNQTINIGTGAQSAATKTINIGTNTAAGGTTAINIGTNTTTTTSTTVSIGNNTASTTSNINLYGQSTVGKSTSSSSTGTVTGYPTTIATQSTSNTNAGALASVNGSNLTITSGDASLPAGLGIAISGNLTLDVGSASAPGGSTTTGTISIGTSQASGITLGKSGTNTTVSGKFGYTTDGGNVAQGTSATTTITLNATCGSFTLFSAARAAGASSTFTFTNSTISGNDILVFMHESGGTLGAYNVAASTSSGSATLTVRNLTAGSLTEAPTFRFIVIKA